MAQRWDSYYDACLYTMLCCIPCFAFVLKILFCAHFLHLDYALHIQYVYIGIMLLVLATIGLNRLIVDRGVDNRAALDELS